MDVFEAIHKRRSIRAFKQDPVCEEDLKKILEAAIAAPSAGNRQPWEFIVVRDAERKRELVEAALGQSFIEEAPVVIIVCANLARSSRVYGKRGEELYAIQDTAAAIQNMLLAAFALGYGTCWIGAFDEREVSRILKIPSGVRPVAIIPIGKPAEKPSKTPRLPLDEVVHRETY
ncbi:MAG: nitroreductase family protein [Candidatus Hadarchaeales archaeon]